MMTDFEKFAFDRPVSMIGLDKYKKTIDGYINPTILEERKLNVTQMDVFSRLMKDRQIFLGTAIDSDVANIINAQLLYLDSLGEEDITIIVNSPGGSVYDGEAIVDTMNYISSHVCTQCAGLAASMGSVILASGEPGQRYALPHSRIMIHQPMSGMPPHSQASDIEINCKEILKLKYELSEMLANASGKTVEEVIADADRDHWLIAAEALPGAYGPKGLIDNIITSKKS